MTIDQTLFLTQIAFIVIIAIPSIVTIAVMVGVAWRFLPVMVKQMQQLVDNNAQLTKIAKQNADQNSDTQQVLAGIQPELVKQTKAIEAGNTLISTQGIDFRSYQTLISDGMSNHTTQIEANTAKLEAYAASISLLQTTLAALPAQIVQAIQDEFTCETILNEFKNLRTEVSRAMFQQQRSTGSFPVVPPTNPPQNQGGSG